MTERDEEASLWECVHCHTAFAGSISPEVLRMLARRIRLAALHFDAEQAEPLNDAVLQVAWRSSLRGNGDTHRDIRRSRRVAGMREVVALRLDERYVITGEPINGIVANLSRHGQMLITTSQIQSPAILTQFQNAQRTIQLVGRIVWSRYLDVGCYGAGVDFVARLGRSGLD